MRPCCGPVLAKSAEGPHIGWGEQTIPGSFSAVDVRAVASRIVQTAIHFRIVFDSIDGQTLCNEGSNAGKKAGLINWETIEKTKDGQHAERRSDFGASRNR